jgi:H+-transporting ATPase
MERVTLSRDEVKEASVEEVLDRLSTSREGLSGQEAGERGSLYGANEITEERTSPLRKFLGYFWGPIPWMIEAAVVLSAAISRWEDFGIILVLLVLNAVIGFWQERNADNAIEMLKRRLAPSARVRRDGKWRTLPAKELVPGDVVRIRLGDVVPADVKLMEGEFLLLDESALTGESLPVERRAGDVAFSGSSVKQGEMDALVLATGMDSYFGMTTRLVEEAKVESHFQKAVIKIGDYLIALAIGLVAVIMVVAMYRQESFAEALQFAMVLTVAAIPAALPAVLSVTLAVGARALARREAIVSRLVSIEEMAGMDILCSDKTGTITKSELTLAEVLPIGDATEADVLAEAVLASREEDQDPIDDAVYSKARETEGVMERVGRFEVLEFTPFDPVSKRTEARVGDGQAGSFRVTKGAPQVLMDLQEGNGVGDLDLEGTLDAFASKGYRTLAVARADGEGGWRMRGLLALYDPPREDSGETIGTAEEMGVDVKMVTGDHAAIAKEIARRVGLGTNISTASDVLDGPTSDALEAIETSDGFAQVFPEHKFHIVELLQSKGHIVGMTGDGVNDAPALKEADVGIAVAGATDAAKSSADIVLTSPGLSVIVDALKESRKIFQRMKNYSVYRIAETIRVLLFITASILVFSFYPVTAVMIVLLALLNDAPIMAIASDNVKYSRTPERWDMREVLVMATVLGLVGVFSSFFIFYIAKNYLALGDGLVQSVVFLKLAVAGHLTIFITRTRGPFWSIRPSGALLWSAVATKALATLMVVYGLFVTPTGWALAGLVWGYALAAFVVTDLVKVQLYKYIDHRGIGSRG